MMNQLHSYDKRVWCSLACDLCTAVYNTISIHSRPIMIVQQGQNSTQRERERETAVCVECLRLRVFKSLPTSHATAMCTRHYTCRGWEYWSERTRGRASRRVGGVHRGEGGGGTTTGRVSLCLLDFTPNI